MREFSDSKASWHGADEEISLTIKGGKLASKRVTLSSLSEEDPDFHTLQDKQSFDLPESIDDSEEISIAPEAFHDLVPPIAPMKTSLFETGESQDRISFTADQSRIDEFALSYPSGFSAFEADLNRDFISKIQGPDPQPGFFAALFGAVPEKANACLLLSSYTIGEVKDLASFGNESKCEVFLTEHNIARNDFDIWLETLSTWEGTGLVKFNNDTNFGNVVRAAFISQLQSTPPNIA